jgi:predicted DNA-binding transcriptional regulator YafY
MKKDKHADGLSLTLSFFSGCHGMYSDSVWNGGTGGCVKLARLWDLKLCEETYTQREIPPERQDFNAYLQDDKKLVASFELSVKYQLIEAYGLNCFTETGDGRLRLEIGYTNRDYIISWLLGFGSKAKVIEPIDMADEIKRIAENIIQNYQ